jgi:ribosomal protein S18 acetylase RimI-like enzyme
MTSFTVQPLRRHPIDRIAAFVEALNHQPEHHICYFGSGAEEIAAQIQGLVPAPEDDFLIAEVDDIPVGVLGFDVDESAGRAWLYGPIVLHTNWDDCADLLYSAVIARLNDNIQKQEICTDSRNERVGNFALRHGFSSHDSGNISVLILYRDRYLPQAASKLQTIHASQTHSLVILHDELFPNTYYPGRVLLERQTEHARLFVLNADANSSMVGYVYAQVNPATGEGYIDYIGVKPTMQRRGYGTALVDGVLEWIFSFDFVKLVSLTVPTASTIAVRLYERAGFIQERTIMAYRKVGR